MSFHPRPVYLTDSFMLPVGKYNGRQDRPGSSSRQGGAEKPCLTEPAGKIHINMHDPFNGFGPISLHVNDVPSRRFYKKTIEGVVDLADSAFRHLGLKKS